MDRNKSIGRSTPGVEVYWMHAALLKAEDWVRILATDHNMGMWGNGEPAILIRSKTQFNSALAYAVSVRID